MPDTPPPRLTDVQYLAALGVPVEDIAARAGLTPHAIRLELERTENPHT